MNSSMLIGINTVVHKGNYDEILDIINFAEKLSVDLVDLIRLDTCANNATVLLSQKDEKRLYKQVGKLHTFDKFELMIKIPFVKVAAYSKKYEQISSTLYYACMQPSLDTLLLENALLKSHLKTAQKRIQELEERVNLNMESIII